MFLNAHQPGRFDSENEGFFSEEAPGIYDELYFFTEDVNLKQQDTENISPTLLDCVP